MQRPAIAVGLGWFSGSLLFSTIGCAQGGDGRQSTGVAESTSSGDPTAETIDPTVFGTSLADESTTGPGPETTLDATTTPETGSSGASADTGVGDVPTVESITPDAAEGVAPDAAITVTFSIEMDAETITADDGDCTGTIAVSRDDFATCEPLDAAVVRDGLSFAVQPSSPLESASTYRVRVGASARSVGGVPLAADHVSRGFVSRYWHTISIDGQDDWASDETLSTSTVGHSARVAWDEDYVYVAMQSPDVAAAQTTTWFVVYFGGAAGTSQGVLYNTQQPSLPFDAQYHLRWRADNIYTDVLAWDGGAWSPGGWAIAKGDVFAQGELVELRVERASLGDPSALSLHLGLLREANLDEASWAACPEGSYTDGYDPDYLAYWSFDLAGSVPPADHVPQQ